MRHDDEKDPAAAALAAVAGLARQTETLARDAAAMKKGLQQAASAAEVIRLAQVVTELGEAISKAPRSKGDEPEPIPSWLVLPMDADDARTVLGDLLGWMRDVYLGYADARRTLPQCWLWHGDVVEELVWLMYAWTAAYQGPEASLRLAGDWHDRQRPGVARRIGDYAGGCNLVQHKAALGSAVAVPLADAADAIVTWWTTERDQPGPAPTPEQIAAARLALSDTETGDRR
jgi:hypothetical protein